MKKLSGVKNGNSKIIRRMSVLPVSGCALTDIALLSMFANSQRKNNFVGGISNGALKGYLSEIQICHNLCACWEMRGLSYQTLERLFHCDCW